AIRCFRRSARCTPWTSSTFQEISDGTKCTPRRDETRSTPARRSEMTLQRPEDGTQRNVGRRPEPPSECGSSPVIAAQDAPLRLLGVALARTPGRLVALRGQRHACIPTGLAAPADPTASILFGGHPSGRRRGRGRGCAPDVCHGL